LPTGYLLTWTEQLPGDYDQNGEANVADITALANAWQATVLYDDPLAHDGYDAFPVGDPDFDGDAAAGEPPVIGSGAYNWRLARIDADGNGEINLGEITALAQHFKERLSGYHLYRRKEGTSTFVLVPDASAPGAPLLIGRATANGGNGIDPRRPVRYSYFDPFQVDGVYEYRVAAFDTESQTEGPPSLPGFDVAALAHAVVTADVVQGTAPLVVNFDASGSTVEGGTVIAYYWDFNDDGIYETPTGAVSTATHTFTSTGEKHVHMGIEGSTGDTATTEIVISVTVPPVARLKLNTVLREVPITLTLDATGSTDADGDVVRYFWDMDGDGIFELDAGPLAQRELQFDAAGTYSVGVKVADNLGATGSTTLQFTLTDDYDEVEPNDNAFTSTPLGTLAVGESRDGLVGSIGLGLYDGSMEDWYSVDVATGAQINANLAFQNADANLDLMLVDNTGAAVIAAASTANDGEQLLGKVKRAGRYYLRVYRAAAPGGNTAAYTLDVGVDQLVYDEVEPNNSAATAMDLGSIDLGLLPSFWGRLGQPVSDSEDWFRFSTGLSADFVVNLAFYHDQADLELQLLSSDGQSLLGDSSSVNDGERILLHLDPGTYLVRCYRFGEGNANYDLSILLQ
jgi:PKD repeat protein